MTSSRPTVINPCIITRSPMQSAPAEPLHWAATSLPASRAAKVSLSTTPAPTVTAPGVNTSPGNGGLKNGPMSSFPFHTSTSCLLSRMNSTLLLCETKKYSTQSCSAVSKKQCLRLGQTVNGSAAQSDLLPYSIPGDRTSWTTPIYIVSFRQVASAETAPTGYHAKTSSSFPLP